MPFDLDELFDTEDVEVTHWEPIEWSQEVFTRAYYYDSGPFQRVCDRLRLGFSVLVYLPGNCMGAAAEVVKHEVGDPGDWSEYGKHPGGNDPLLLDDMWTKASTSMFEQVASWFTASKDDRPGAIFHNLDLLGDGHGGIYPHIAAQTALFSLVESVRTGRVLGLSDRDAGELPEPLRRSFDEHVVLDAIPHDNFRRLVPRSLGRRLTKGSYISDGSLWLIASRLRWTDPIRAVRIMEEVAKRHEGIDNVLDAIMSATQTVEFLDAKEVAGGAELRLKGFEADTIRLLHNNIIRPFKNWANFSGSREACERQLRKLPPGLILYGPPGTGKTSLARWVAASIGLPVRQVSAADLKQPDYGLTEKLVRKLFREARRAAPCVIVLDDADDLLPDRDEVEGSIAGAERGIVNAFLQELQGWGKPLEGVLVILTTNRFQQLDKAARARLPLHLYIPYPLDEAQVSEIVDATADSYGYELSAEVRTRLVERFMSPVTSDADYARDKRLFAQKNLFSPREIGAAMRHLEDGKVVDGRHFPSLDDVERMEEYLERLNVLGHHT